MRARALERREEDLEEVRLHLRRMRERGKKQFNKKHNIRQDVLKKSIIVLVHNTFRAINILRSYKLSFRW